MEEREILVEERETIDELMSEQNTNLIMFFRNSTSCRWEYRACEAASQTTYNTGTSSGKG